MALRKVGDSTKLKRVLSGLFGGVANAASLQGILGQEGDGDAFPITPGTVPEDPFGVSIASGVEQGGDESFEDMLRKLLEQLGGGAGGF